MSNEINEFFNKNYQDLLEISSDYVRKYDYNMLNSDEIVSELLIYTLNNTNRTNKLLSLMRISAATINYKYDNRAMYYLITIIWRVCYANSSFSNSKKKDKLKIFYSQNMSWYKIMEDNTEINNQDYLTKADIFNTAEAISKKGDNWWKHRVWYDKYGNNMTYRTLSDKYKLSTTPLFHIVKDFNQVLSTELNKLSIDKASQAQQQLS